MRRMPCWMGAFWSALGAIDGMIGFGLVPPPSPLLPRFCSMSLIRFDIGLPGYFTYPPAPGVNTRPLIARQPSGLYMRGEFGFKNVGGEGRPMSSHNTTHLDAPLHFVEGGQDMAAFLNQDHPVERPCLARLLHLAAQADDASCCTRGGVCYREHIRQEDLPSAAALKDYEALLIFSGFGSIMAGVPAGSCYAGDDAGYYHLPWMGEAAACHVRDAGLRLVGIDSPSIEPQISAVPHRMGEAAHRILLGSEPPVLIVECLNAGGLQEQVGFLPEEALLQLVVRRVNAVGADAAPCRALLYFYADDSGGQKLRGLQQQLTPHQMFSAL